MLDVFQYVCAFLPILKKNIRQTKNLAWKLNLMTGPSKELIKGLANKSPFYL